MISPLGLLLFWNSWRLLAGAGDGHTVCVLVEVAQGADLRALRKTWANNGTSVRFVRPEAFPRRKLRVWRWAASWIPKECEWLLTVKSSSYVNLKKVRERIGCFSSDPSLKYLGFLKAEGTVRSGVPGVAVAEGRLGIVLRRSLLRGLPKMLERCEEQPEMAGLEEDVWLGRCLWQHDVHFASFLDPEEVFLEDLELAGSYSKAWKRLAVETEYLYSKLSVLQCLLVLSGLTPEDLVDLHRHVGKSQRWHPGIACTLRGLTWPDARHPLDATRPSLEPEVRQALQACFLSRAYTRWRDGKYGGGQLELTSPEDLAKEWASPSALTTGLAADVLRRAGHKVCVFVLTTSATAKHRADARAVVKTWAAQPRPPGVEVFMVKDNSWSTEELVGASFAARGVRKSHQASPTWADPSVAMVGADTDPARPSPLRRAGTVARQLLAAPVASDDVDLDEVAYGWLASGFGGESEWE
ncbi:Putative indole-3-pyruvate monooxygenase YUCCA10 [Durusdinium trenchii]|uniref:Indole-3-pyruvate monooxygenase YUCCA10 n=1 Tax=Durusdinium trenchii TaxID=1381693 RepID=A0ABP0LW09_9DINO